MSGDIVEWLRIDCECYDNGSCVHAAARDEIVRLRAEVDLKGYRLDDALTEIVRLRAEREDIDLLHVQCTDDDLTFCHECVGGWPCRTHLRLHPEEARRG